jgi:cob(I)alamin adenosyltransferase
MPRLRKIYTRNGDRGITRLGSGRQVPKDAQRVSAYGTVDELNAQIGVALSIGLCARVSERLLTIQNELFHLGSDLATPPERRSRQDVSRMEVRHVEALERLIDELNAFVGPLEDFVLPGGSPGAAALHVARTVCRRAEREVVALSHSEEIGPHLIPYLNRLSDALFVMARYENLQRGISEQLWSPRP